VDGTKLRNNLMSSGSGGNAIGPLTANEYDGYITFQGWNHKASMPWHILPRKSADVTAKLRGGHITIDPATFTGAVPIENKGVGDAQMFAYTLLGTGPDTPRGDRGAGEPNPTMRAVGINTFLTPAGFTCSGSANFVWEFAFNMYERKATPVGTAHEVDIDTNGDGNPDYFIINQDVSGITNITDGRQVTGAYSIATGAGSLRFFVEHATNSTNVILRVCGNDLGLTQADIGKPMSATFYTYTWYFGGLETSILGPFNITPYGEDLTGPPDGALLTYKQKGTLPVTQWDLTPGFDPSQGLLLINNSDFGAANRGGATLATEAVILPR
jgi:minor extracellular serine protease Vpr